MTATTATPADASAEDARARNKDLIFTVLSEAGIRILTADFDGNGDSGQIENIQAWRIDPEKFPGSVADQIPLPDHKVLIASQKPDDLPAETSLWEAIEILAYDYLDETHMGWEVGEGSYGTFVFSVPKRTITLEHHRRYTVAHTTKLEI